MCSDLKNLFDRVVRDCVVVLGDYNVLVDVSRSCSYIWIGLQREIGIMDEDCS